MKKLLKITLASVIAFGVFATPGFAETAPTTFFVDETKLPFEAISGIESERKWGVLENAGYRIEIPEDWNGELVLYAHGYRGEGLELTVSNPRLRQHFLENGYAWAASSYTQNGYSVKQGVLDTKTLLDYFTQEYGEPTKTYITGHSMGGHITAVMTEFYDGTFDGALPMCGVTGDIDLFSYFAGFNLAAQSLSGMDKASQIFPASDDYLTEVVPSMFYKLGLPSSLNEQGLKLKEVTKHLSGGERPMFDQAFSGYLNLLVSVHTKESFLQTNGNIIDNTNIEYRFTNEAALTAEEIAFNESILRVSGQPQTKDATGLEGIPTISGDIDIPVVTLHNLGDLFVPFKMQQTYAERVEAKGKSDLLVNRVNRAMKHCDFTVEEEGMAFDDLVNWVENGEKPAGDDILNVAAVANPTFGTTFTTELRNGDPLKPMVFDGGLLINNRSFFPARALLEGLGAKVDWDHATRTVHVENNLYKVELPIGKNYVLVNGQKVVMEHPAQIIDSKTFVPVRFLAELLGAAVTWNAETYTVEMDANGTKLHIKVR